VGQLPDFLWIDGERYLLQPDIPITIRTGIIEVPAPVCRYHYSYHGGCFERGFLAEWIISRGCLFLMRISGRYEMEHSAPILVDWYTGILVINGIPMRAYGHDLEADEHMHVSVISGVIQSISSQSEAKNDRHQIPNP